MDRPCVFASFCMIYKRVTDDEANKLFYFLQKYSREWPLLNSVTWEENGAIFTNITYGGYIIIIVGLIIGQCSGELQRCRKMENFFLIFGAILFIAAGSLELAALEYVEERLVDNAAILGVFSLITGFLFIIDLLLAGRRRKREKFKTIQKTTFSKPTQTEEMKSIMNKFSDMNGNIQNGEYGGPRIPKNAVKLLPSSPVVSDQTILTTHGPKIEYLDQGKYSTAPPIIEGEELKTHQGKLKSTESFLRSEKGYFPQIQKSFDESNNQIVVPAGYVLVPADHFSTNNIAKSDSGIGESQTPSEYAKIIPEPKMKPVRKGYVVVPVEENNLLKEKPRKLQSPTVTTTVKTPTELHYRDERNRRPLSPYLRRNTFAPNSSDVSDFEESNSREKYKFDIRRGKSPTEYLEMSQKSQEHSFQLDNSSDERKPSYLRDGDYRFGSQKALHRPRKWHRHSGEDNDGYDENFNVSRSRKSSPYRPSSRGSSPEKPKSILRFDYGRSSKKEDGLYFPKDIQYDSLDSKKIAEDLRNLKEITNSGIDLKGNLEKENRALKERLRQEQEAREKLKLNLEDMKKLEKQMRESEEEKNRRVSEREEQYFGIKDLKQSHKERNFDPGYKLKGVENHFRRNIEETGKGAEEMNERLKEKHLDESKASKEVQEYRDLIDERFHFLDEEEKRKKMQESQDVDHFRKMTTSDIKPDSYFGSHNLSDKKPKAQRSDSDEPNNTPSTDDEIRLRVETPGSTSFKSEALFWLGSDQENQTKPSTPISPTSPGYVLYTAQNWPESPSPQDRFQFSAKEAQQLSIGTPPKTPLLERLKPDTSSFEDKKISQKSSLIEFEELPHSANRPGHTGFQRNLLVRKVDFPMEPKKPVAIAGSTSTWKKWLQPRPKLQHTKSTPT